MMKKYYLLLLFFMSLLGYGQVLQPDGSRSVTITEPKAITITGTTENETGPGSKNGKIILAAPLTGTPSYTIECKKGTEIITDLSALSAGTYVITSRNTSSCTNDTKTFVVKQNITCTMPEITHVKCFGGTDGSIKLDIKGGNGNYNVLWNDSVTTKDRPTLKAGTYSFSIQDTNIPPLTYNSNNIIIEGPEKRMTISKPIVSQPSPNQSNGTISIKATDGYGNYTYSWTKDGNAIIPNPNKDYLTGLGDGEYQVTVTDKNATGCSVPSEIITLKALFVKDRAQNNIKCYGEETGSIEVEAVGGTLDQTQTIKEYQYQWYETDNNPNSNDEILTEIEGEKSPKLIGRKEGNYKVKIRDSYDTFLSKNYNLTQPQKPLGAIVSATNENCFGSKDGSATISVSGGTTGYTFLWSNGSTNQNQNNLAAGIYSVTVTDSNKCTVQLTNITITSPTAIIIPTPAIKKVSIFGKSLSDGAITIAPITGGLLENEASTTYTYSWTKDNDTAEISADLSISGLNKGTYHLTVTATNTGCKEKIDCIVFENDQLTVAIKEISSIYCFGTKTGKLHAEIKGGIIPYKIEWYKKNESTNLPELIKVSRYSNSQDSNELDIDTVDSGLYSVKVTDSANPEPTGPFAYAEDIDYILINRKDKLTVSLKSQTNVLCYGNETGTIDIDIKGGTEGYTIQWKKGTELYAAQKDLTKLGEGIYSVLVTDAHGCTASLIDSVTITQPDAPLLITDIAVNNLTGFETKNGNIAVEIAGGTAPYTYAWRNKGITTIIGENKPSIDKLPIGTYELTVIDNNGCPITKEYTLLQPDKLVITAISQTTASAIKCHGDKAGVLMATIIGGAPIGVDDSLKNYTYNWYNVLTPEITASTTNPSETLLAGTYKLEVTDVNNNKFTLQSNPIIEPEPLKITYTQTNVSCKNGKDGAISISVSGGTGNHTVVWSNGKNSKIIEELFAGTYMVTVTDENECVTKETIIVTEPDLLYVSNVSKNPPSALGQKDGSIAITVTGGTPNYNYLWYNDKKELIYSDLNKPSNTSIYNIFAGQYFVTITDAKGCAIVEKDLDKVDPMFVTLNQINIVLCKGDATASIKASASGGVPIYYYKWYKTTDPLNSIGNAEVLPNANAGIYYVVVTDSFGKSIQSNSITITEPTLLVNTLSAEYTRCGDANDWTITTAATGGTAPYTYLWNTGARSANLQNVPPANYSVLITDKQGCTIAKSILITAPIHLAASENIKIPTCFGGSDASIILSVSGGKAPYTYLWKTGELTDTLNFIAAGTYSVAITDAKGCVIDKTYAVVNPPKDIINIGDDVTLCIGQSLTINATINDNKATYSWTSDKGFTSNKPMITVSEPANYTVIITNKLGCKATDTIEIKSQITDISAEFAVSSQVFVNEKIVIIDISNPLPDSIEWVFPVGATVTTKNKDFAEISFGKAGEYELTLNTKKGNCTAYQTKKILVVEGEYKDPDATDLQKNFDMKIYPNPSNGIFTVDVTLDKAMPAHVKVYNLTNNKIIDSKFEEGKAAHSFNFSLNGLTAGVYFVLFESQQGNQLRKIIIK